MHDAYWTKFCLQNVVICESNSAIAASVSDLLTEAIVDVKLTFDLNKSNQQRIARIVRCDGQRAENVEQCLHIARAQQINVVQTAL